ncbi:glycerophosphodiester phosphodiesterase [Microbulbifer aggregans]|uniref:glycerophosphodiester phosphodiesterase n=1 Tax=Microbulbifer aggregans TaxID=1769779 RepID=UPI001CFED3C2|nr:glycerophosphodiester phosphodiesterase [Microbulbifer aggregans]
MFRRLHKTLSPSHCWCALFALVLAIPLSSPAVGKSHTSPIVIAHRGASGYLPEHTLEAKALAYGMRADFIEQDLVLSKDGHLIVTHDIYLDGVTDVASRFPERVRDDGHFYAIDFTLEELKQLRVSETFASHLGLQVPKYPERFPLWKSSFQLSTFEEELELIQGLNKSLGYNTGIYPEIKKPAFHRREGLDISRKVLEVLKQYGYINSQQKVFLQCFDAEELQHIHATLMPELDMDLPLVQLIAESQWGEKRIKRDGKWVNYDYDWMRTEKGLERIAQYASGIGPWYPMLLDSSDGAPAVNELTRKAHALGLKVHPYTFRADAGQLPANVTSFDGLLALYINQVSVDGLFTDHPDKVRAYLQQRENTSRSTKVTPTNQAPEDNYPKD